jgi:hypothetical protein
MYLYTLVWGRRDPRPEQDPSRMEAQSHRLLGKSGDLLIRYHLGDQGAVGSLSRIAHPMRAWKELLEIGRRRKVTVTKSQ